MRCRWLQLRGSAGAKGDIADGTLNWTAYSTNQLLDYSAPPYYASSTKGLTTATEVSYTHDLGAHQLIGGGEYRNESNTNTATGSERAYHAIYNRALFVQDRWQINPLTEMIFGTRLDDHSTAGSRLSPRIGINRAVAKNTNLRASYATGFRAPNFVELYCAYPDPYEHKYGYVGNPALRPETSQQFEIGLNSRLKHGTIDLALFSTSTRDEILPDLLTNPTGDYQYTYDNVSRASHRGVELSYGHQFSPATSVDFTYSYLAAKSLPDGNPLKGIPHNTVSFTATQNIQNWDISLIGRWIGERLDVTGVTAPTITTFDLTLQPHGEKMRLKPFAIIRNLTNTSYEEVIGYPVEGRSFELGLRSAW